MAPAFTVKNGPRDSGPPYRTARQRGGRSTCRPAGRVEDAAARRAPLDQLVDEAAMDGADRPTPAGRRLRREGCRAALPPPGAVPQATPAVHLPPPLTRSSPMIGSWSPSSRV